MPWTHLNQAIVLAAACSVAANAHAEDVAIERFDLPNGIHVAAACVPEAPRQAMFTFLPLTMSQDDAARAQWAHLVEHMLIRTTDPLRLAFDGMQFNGETMHTSLRLETFADPAKWLDAMDRHVHWLVARQLDPAALEREKGNIAGEERSTSETGMTGKFAIAAWNQVVRHGVAHAAVHGDVANADLHAVQDYVWAHVSADGTVLLATIGPRTLDDVKKEIEQRYAKLETVHVPPPEAAVDPERYSANLQATWDLPTRHAMWWWKLPDREPATLAAATAFAQALMIQAMGAKEIKDATRAVLVNPIVPTPEGAFLMIDCSLAANADPATVWAALRAQLDGFAPGGPRRASVPFAGRMAAQSLMPKPDFKALRTQLRAPMRGIAEGNWMLGMMNVEYVWGIPCEQAVEILMKLDDAAVAPLVDQILATAPGSLHLAPGAAPERPATQPAAPASSMPTTPEVSPK